MGASRRLLATLLTLVSAGFLNRKGGRPQQAPLVPIVRLGVGAPTKTFSFILDTASSNVILPGTPCEDGVCVMRQRYDPALSGGCTVPATLPQPLDQAKLTKPEDRLKPDEHACDPHGLGLALAASASLGGGTLTGRYLEDRLCLSASACSRLGIVVAHQMDALPFAHIPADGVFGIAPREDEDDAILNLLKQGAIANGRLQIWTACVQRDGAAAHSEVNFGAINPARLASKAYFQPAVGMGLWQVHVHSIRLNGAALGVCGPNSVRKAPCSAVVDTTSSMLLGPKDVIEKLLVQLAIAPDCSNLHSLPPFSFELNTVELAVPASAYVSENSDGSCTPRIKVGTMGRGDALILGAPFLEEYTVVLDRVGMQIGFAESKHAGVPDGQLRATPKVA